MIDHLRDGSYREEVRRYFDKPEKLKRFLTPILEMLGYEVDFRSAQTVIHNITVNLLAQIIGRYMGCDKEEINSLHYAAIIHDIGKIKIPTSILEKPGRLTEEEFETMKLHVTYSRELAQEIGPQNIIDIATRHHEKLDGSGYPDGLVAEQLTKLDRIMIVADIASALLYKRTYKEAMDKETVISILEKEVESYHIDGEIVKVFVNNYDSIVAEVKSKSNYIIEKYENFQKEYREYLNKYSDLEETSMDQYELFSLN